jgi:hypothetical protein
MNGLLAESTGLGRACLLRKLLGTIVSQWAIFERCRTGIYFLIAFHVPGDEDMHEQIAYGMEVMGLRCALHPRPCRSDTCMCIRACVYSHCPHTHACPPSHCDEATLYRDWWFKPVTHVPVSLLHCGGRESFHSLTHSLTHLLTYLPTYVTYLLTYSHCPHTHALHTAHCAHSTRVSASG